MLAGAFGILAAFALSQIVLTWAGDARLEEYQDELLDHAVEVAQSSRNALSTVNASDALMCSDADLNEMRHLSFGSEYLRDVGRIMDGAIVCTALWDRLSPPAKLPPPQRIQHENDMLWTNITEIGELRLKVDMAARGTAIVFTSPVAFKAYEMRGDNFSAYVLTRDGQHIYRSFGETAGLNASATQRTPWYDFNPRRIASKCSSEVDICVTAALANINVLRLSSQALLGIGFLGAITGASFGVASVLRDRTLSSLPQRIARGVADGRLSVVYQPLVNMKDGSPVGFEALARLTNEHGESIPPEVFISTAEETGLIGKITRIVIRTALADMECKLLGRSDFHLSFNLCVSDILDRSLCTFLDEEVARLGISPKQIILEITERSTVNHGELVEAMEVFRKSGYQFYVDDFGTGYSSLAYLAKLPINGIKIDRMFTQAIGTQAVISAIVQNICSIADTLGVKLVVEGVETREQAAYILKLHPDAIGQGWLYGKPQKPKNLQQRPSS